MTAKTKAGEGARGTLKREAKSERDYYIRARARLMGLTSKAVRALNEALGSENDAVKLAAAREVLDRAFGKAAATVQHNVTTVDLTALHLEAVRALAGQSVTRPDVLDRLDNPKAAPVLDLKPVQSV